MAKVSNKQELANRHQVDAIESALRARGIYHMPNEPGFSYSVIEELRRRHRNSDFRIQEPPHHFGGEYIFTSTSHLGTKPE